MANKTYVVDLNLGGNEIQNAVIQNLASAPANPKAGQQYFNTTDNNLYVYDGNNWVDETSQGKIYTFSTGLTETNGTVTLNTASTSAFGGVTVGTNISVSNGTISVADASTTAKGLIEIATDTEASTGTSTTLAVTPKQLDTKVTKLSTKPTAGTYTKVTINSEGQVTTGASLGSTDVTNALGYTPYNSTNPAGYITSSALASYVPTSRTVNSKALSSDITLDASDVGALPSTTTINDLTSSAQQSALNSGATSTNIGQIATNTSAISTINGKIPTQASTTNQLADKAFVNSTVQTNTANFRGNWATWSAVPTSANDYPADYAGSKTPTVNDYMVVDDASGYTGQTLTGTWRFKYSGTWSTDGKSGWLPEYQVNETPLTAAQIAAINSGITSTLVGQITTNANDIASLQQSSVTASSTTTFTNKTIDGDDNTIKDLGIGVFKSGTVQTTVRGISSASDSCLATEKAISTAVSDVKTLMPKYQIANNPALTASGGVCTWTVAHTTGLVAVTCSVRDYTTGNEVACDITYGNASTTIKINSTSNIAANTYKAYFLVVE